MKFEWLKGSASNFGYIEDSDIRVERYSKPDKSLYFFLSSSKKTYFKHSGPFYSPKDRDKAVLDDVIEFEKTRDLRRL